MTIIAKFNGRCVACGQALAAGSTIEWTKGVGARHAGTCPPAAVVPVVTVQAGAIVAFLQAARDRGLKAPKARFLAPGGGELRLALAGSTSKYPGAVQVKVDGTWVGRIEASGVVAGPLAGTWGAPIVAALDIVASNPAAAAKAYGALMCRCSFCNLSLTDAGSVEVGYGPVCAQHWGLPHAPKGTPAVSTVVPFVFGPLTAIQADGGASYEGVQNAGIDY